MFTYENQGTNTYLVYRFQPEDKIDTLSIGMISNNNIKGVASLVYTQLNTDKFVKFNVSSMITLEQFLKGTVNKKRLMGVFKNICETMLEAEEYMLDAESFLWNTDSIYVDVSTNETAMICLPVLERQNVLDIKMFFKQIMFETKFDDSEDCSYIAKIVNFLNSTGIFSIDGFKQELEELEKETVSVTKMASANTVKASGRAMQTASSSQLEPKGEKPQAAATQVEKVQNKNGYSVAKVIAKQEQMKAEREIMATQGTQIPQAAVMLPGMPEPVKDAPVTKSGQLSGLFKKADKKAEKKQEVKPEKKAGGIFGGKKKAKASTEVPSMQTIPGFKVPGMHNPEENYTAPSQSEVKSAESQAVPVMRPEVVTSTVAQPEVVSRAANFGSTTVLNMTNINATQVLDAGNAAPEGKRAAYLLRVKNNDKVFFKDNEVVTIGKEEQFVSYAILDNSTISRCHVNLYMRSEVCFIEDTNSTNHTYVNGQVITSGQQIQLHDGDKVELSNEEFIFRAMQS